jgi:hypothetical protein
MDPPFSHIGIGRGEPKKKKKEKEKKVVRKVRNENEKKAGDKYIH